MTKHSRLKERDNWKERKYVNNEMFNSDVRRRMRNNLNLWKIVGKGKVIHKSYNNEEIITIGNT